MKRRRPTQAVFRSAKMDPDFTCGQSQACMWPERDAVRETQAAAGCAMPKSVAMNSNVAVFRL